MSSWRFAWVAGVAAATAGSLVACGGSTVEPETAGSAPPATTAPAEGEPSVPPPPEATTEWITVPAPAIEGNLLDDPAELRAAIWLPPSYSTTDDHYPVVYFLAGFGEDASVTPIGGALEDAIHQAGAPEMIVVGVSGLNSLGGSFYVDSPVTGGWATAVHRDLVGWIDDHYRTISEPAARVIAGFSMGGFGAFDLAMRHPDVFGAVYALSPGMLAPGGLADMEMFASEVPIESYLQMEAALAAGDPPPPLTEGARFALAYGSAFALDVGTNDPYQWIPDGTRHLADTLEASGIQVQYTTYPGGHGPVSARAPETLVPFLARVLPADD